MVVSRTGNLQQHEEVHHRVHGGFRLSDAHRFDEDDVESRASHSTIVSRVFRATPPSDPAEGEGAVLALDADVQAACLCIAQIGAGADLEILLLTGAPSLDIAALDLQVGEVAGAAVQLTDGDLHIAEQLDGVLPELLIPVGALLGAADDDHLLLLELVDAVDAALLDAVGALLLADCLLSTSRCV